MNISLKTLEYYLFCIFFLALSLGPWMKTSFQYFNFGYFEKNSLLVMTLDLCSRIPETFWIHSWFLAVPFSILLFKYLLETLSNKVYYVSLRLGQIYSIFLLPLVFYTNQHVYNPVSDVFVADFLMMIFWHAYLIINDELMPITFLGGPLCGLCTYLLDETEKNKNIFVAILFLYSTIPSLYRAYSDIETSTLQGVIPFSSWNGYEMYSLLCIFYGSFVLCFSIKAVTLLEYIEALFYIILINANVAAAWVGLVGFKRNLAKPEPVKFFYNFFN